MKNPLTYEAFADWCEKQPADKRYDYTDATTCACGRYFQDTMGMTWGEVNELNFDALTDLNAIASGTPHTFGALARRLRAKAQ